MTAPVRTLVMGVLNVTPDSFSDGGRYLDEEAAILRGRQLFADGADIIDVGGESTRPGATPVAPAAEQQRVLRVVRALTEAGIPVSIDTIHAETAAAAVAAGARYINDVSGGTWDPAMFEVAAAASRDHGGTFIIGHWRGVPDPAHQRSDYADVVTEVRDALAELVARARGAGVADAHIVLDPGLGFDKTTEQGWRLLAEVHTLQALGYPVLVGASRKRMLTHTLTAVAPRSAVAPSDAVAPRSAVVPNDVVVLGDADPTAQVPGHPADLATAVVTALSAAAGAWGVRVHDVRGSVQALAVADAWGAQIPSDRITLTGLEVFAHHGVFEFERERGQRFLIDAEVAVDLRAAAAGDALGDTVHYGELADAIVAAVAADPVDLIETVADRVAGVALSFNGVQWTRVTVHKPDAPITDPFTDVSVTIERRASGGSQITSAPEADA